jgi:hypothetical protein
MFLVAINCQNIIKRNFMPQVHVKIKRTDTKTNSSSTQTASVYVQQNPPTESAVIAKLKEQFPKGNEFVILEMKAQ